MSTDPYAVDPKRAATYARRLINLTPPNLPVPVAIGGALTYVTAMAFDNAEVARRTATALRLIAADLDQRAAALAQH